MTPIWRPNPETSLRLDPRDQRLGQICENWCNLRGPGETDEQTSKLEFFNKQREDDHVQEVFDLISEDDSLNVYAGELEVRPPGAPTTRWIGAAAKAAKGRKAIPSRKGAPRSFERSLRGTRLPDSNAHSIARRSRKNATVLPSERDSF